MNGVARSGKIAASVPVPGVSSRVLQLTRRLDFRFLLPCPELGKVGYFGPPCELLSALQLFSDSVTVFSDEPLGPVYPRFDTVVLRYPAPRTVETASKCLRPGGSAYIELAGLLGRITRKNHAPGSLPGLVKYSHVLWGAGFEKVEAYWHRPGFDDCHQIIPLLDRVAMAFVLSREGPRHFSREVKLFASRCLMQTGILPHIVPCYSIVAHKHK